MANTDFAPYNFTVLTPYLPHCTYRIFNVFSPYVHCICRIAYFPPYWPTLIENSTNIRRVPPLVAASVASRVGRAAWRPPSPAARARHAHCRNGR
eukprot:7541685-Pyramimonas_sp.AAC.1